MCANGCYPMIEHADFIIMIFFSCLRNFVFHFNKSMVTYLNRGIFAAALHIG